jgi:hypothetical protein
MPHLMAEGLRPIASRAGERSHDRPWLAALITGGLGYPRVPKSNDHSGHLYP